SADVDLLAYVRASNLMRLLIHARSFARTVDESGADVLRRREFVELARPYAAGFSLADISGANFLLARHRVQWYLLSQGRDEDLATFLAKEPKVPVSRTEGDAQWYDYTSILPDLLPEVCWEPRRAIGQVAIGRVDTASRVLEVVAEIPAGMSIEPLHLVLRPRSPATSERLPVRTCALGRFAVDLAMDRLPDPLPPLALEYLAGGRVCVAPVSVDAVG
ncbi:MAG: hypothetical protein VB093_00100, partial [Propionicimonas sp.]|nr:hypothetical protein [Propionicimonas sp.]